MVGFYSHVTIVINCGRDLFLIFRRRHKQSDGTHTHRKVQGKQGNKRAKHVEVVVVEVHSGDKKANS